MGLLAAAGGAGVWTWHKANSVPATVRAKGDFWQSVRHRERPKIPPPTREELTRQRELARQSKARMIEKYPLLAVEMHPVPDGENAFRLLYQLGQEFGNHQVTISPQLKKLLESGELPDAETAKAALAENADFMSRIERIAALTTRSSANMPDDYVGFVGAAAVKSASDILLVKARLAARDGDPDEVLRLVATARNLSDHYRNLETPTLLTETVTILLDLGTAAVAFKDLIPASNRPGDLDQWQELLNPGAQSPAEFGHVLRGEWHSGAEHWLRNFNPRDPDVPPDPEALADAFAGAYHAQIVKLNDPAADFADLRDLSIYNSADFPDLSPQSRKVMDTLWIGASTWAKGYCRGVTILNQYQAAIELLRLEQAGTTLDPALCATLTRDPVTGQPFLLNPATRELSAPNGADTTIKPLGLPTL